MLGFGWLALRQAQEALKNGRLEEAQRLLIQPAVQGHKRGHDLARQLTQALVQRAERYLGTSDLVAAWNDLLKAEQFEVDDEAVLRLRQALNRQGLAEVCERLEAGEPRRAAEAVAQLRERNCRGSELDRLEEAASAWVRANELADRGELHQALLSLECACRLLPDNAVLAACAGSVRERERTFPALVLQLHRAGQQARWQEVLELSDQVLALAPNHAEARKLRAHAWGSLEPVTIVTKQPRQEAAPAGQKAANQYLLWIDGVGGYLICLDNKVTFGQAIPEAHVDVPIFADVSRHHATLTRDTEGYLLEAVRAVQVNGKKTERTLLHPGDRVTLGTSCQLQFRQPVPVSASAVLELVSGHRLRISVNAVLLMADTIVLGPGPQAHVIMPDLRQPVVLYRHKDGLGIRSHGQVLINDRPFEERGVIEPGATAVGVDFSLGLELVGS